MSEPVRQRAKQERAETTRKRLLDATLSVIQREGWSGTTTGKVCQEASVSSGAQTHHFPRKNDLLVAALQRNRDVLRARSPLRQEPRSGSKVPMRAFLQGLRLSEQDDAYFYATVESLVAARTDAQLREEVRAIDAEWVGTICSNARARIGPDLSDERVEDLVELTLYLVRGLVVQRGLHSDPERLDALFDLWCDVVGQAFAPGDDTQSTEERPADSG